MPKEISHIYFSEEIQKSLNEDIKNILSQHMNLYYYGSTSPDIFYYYLPNKKLSQKITSIDWGSLIHDDSNNMEPIYRLLNLAKTSEYKNEIFCFVGGYLTHVAADTIFHPYIYSITGYYYDKNPSLQKEYQRNHRLFETIMDIYILNNIYKLSLKDFKLSKKLLLSNSELKILFLYGKSLKDFFYPEIDDKEMEDYVYYCYNNHIKLTKIFQKTWLVNLLIPLKKYSKELDSILALCYGNHPESKYIDFLKFFEAPHPIHNTIIQGNFFEFLEKIKKRGRDFIHAIYEFLYKDKNLNEVKQLIPNYSLNTGEIKISHEQMKYFNIHPAFRKAS